ncbi:unnamed protein product [Caenorhabditis brenneri]
MQELVLKTGLTRSQITGWFQYRRRKFNAALKREATTVIRALRDMSVKTGRDAAEKMNKYTSDEHGTVTTNPLHGSMPCFGVINQPTVVYPTTIDNPQLMNITTLYSSHASVDMKTLFVLHSWCDFCKQLPIKSLGLFPTSTEVVNYVKEIESMFNHITDSATTIANAKMLFENRFGHYYVWDKKGMLVDAITASIVATNSTVTTETNSSE